MAYTADQLKETIRKYVDLIKREIPVDSVILFGSYAWGKPKSYSDIDLAVVSTRFKDKDEIKNMQFLFKRACEIDPAIEPHPFHPQALKRPDRRTILFQIITRGKKIRV